MQRIFPISYRYEDDGTEVSQETVNYYVRNGNIEGLEKLCKTGSSGDPDAPADIRRAILGLMGTSSAVPKVSKIGTNVSAPQGLIPQTMPYLHAKYEGRTVLSFDITILRFLRYHADMSMTGRIIEQKYYTRIESSSIMSKTQVYVEATLEELYNIKNYDKWSGGKIWYQGTPKDVKERLRELVYLRINSPHIMLVEMFPHCGYIRAYGSLYFVSGKELILSGNVCLKSIDNKMLFDEDTKLDLKSVMEIERIFKDRDVGRVMLGILLLSCLVPVLEEVGYPPKFVLVIVGPTGCRKTTIAKLFYSLFNRNANEVSLDAEGSFLMDLKQIENLVYESGSPVLLVDDFRPLCESTAHKIQLNKLEKLCRIYGDRIRSKRNEYPNGIGAITAEFIDSDINESTLLRMIIVELNKDSVNNDMLSAFQNNTMVLPTFVASFIRYVCEKYNALIEYANNSIANNRAKYKEVFKDARLAEYAAQLDFATECFVKYLEVQNVTGTDEIRKQYEQAVLNILKNNERMLHDDSVIENAIRAFREDYETLRAAYVDVPVQGKLAMGTERIIGNDKVYIMTNTTKEILDEHDIEFNKTVKMGLVDMRIMLKYHEGCKCRYDTRLKFVEGQCRYSVFDKKALLG